MIILYKTYEINMKYIYIFIFLLIFLSPVYLFSRDTIKIKPDERVPADLELLVKVKMTGAIGYAYCFSGEVLDVLNGKMPDKKILITILPGDTAYLNILSRAGENDMLKLFLMFNKANEEYSTTIIDGFVDSEKNSWRIIDIQKSN
jgi:hypothetical protein